MVRGAPLQMLADAEEKVYREQAKRKCLTLLNDQLVRAAKDNRLSIAKAALKEGADIDYQDSMGMSAVMHATCRGSERVLRFLCAKGANTNLISKQGCTALVMAARDDNLEIARCLMGSRARKSQRTMSGRTALHCAAACNSTRVAELMLKGQTSSQKSGIAFIAKMAPEDVNAVDNGGATAMHEAALQDHCSMIKLMLGQGATQSVQDQQCKAPTDVAHMRGFANSTKALAAYNTRAALKAANSSPAGDGGKAAERAASKKQLRQLQKAVHARRQ